MGVQSTPSTSKSSHGNELWDVDVYKQACGYGYVCVSQNRDKREMTHGLRVVDYFV